MSLDEKILKIIKSLHVGKQNGAMQLVGARIGILNGVPGVKHLGAEIVKYNSKTSEECEPNIAHGTYIGISNIDTVLKGIDVGIVSHASKVYGIQAGIISNATEIYGLEVGLDVEANEVHGAQVGFSCRAKKFNGLQMGVLCYAEKGNFAQVGVLTIRKTGPKYLRVTPFFGFGITRQNKYKFINPDLRTKDINSIKNLAKEQAYINEKPNNEIRNYELVK